jgi:hypothetical protein
MPIPRGLKKIAPAGPMRTKIIIKIITNFLGIIFFFGAMFSRD